MMIGFCHNRLGQYDQEIEAYEQIISEYSRVHNFSGVYFYLGRAYMERGQNDKAVEAFENCLTAGGGTTDPNTFPLKDARDYITRLKGQ
jgi:tetratricopeptide (TPR) repeat protein